MPLASAQARSSLRQSSWMPACLRICAAIPCPRYIMLAFAPGFMHAITTRLDASAPSLAHAARSRHQHRHRTEEFHVIPSFAGAGGKRVRKAAKAVLGFFRVLPWNRRNRRKSLVC